MSDLLNSYTFEAKKIVYYSVTVGAENKTEAKRIAKDFEHCKHYEEVEYCDGYEYKVGKMLETTDEKWLTWTNSPILTHHSSQIGVKLTTLI